MKPTLVHRLRGRSICFLGKPMACSRHADTGPALSSRRSLRVAVLTEAGFMASFPALSITYFFTTFLAFRSRTMQVYAGGNHGEQKYRLWHDLDWPERRRPVSAAKISRGLSQWCRFSDPDWRPGGRPGGH